MLVRILNSAEEGLIALLLVSMTLLVFVEVVLRFVFATGFIWIEELTLHMSAWMVLFGASWALKVGAHIGVDAVVRLLTPGVQRIVGGIAAVLATLYCGMLMYGGWVYLAKIKKIDLEMESIVFPKWIAHSILVIGLGLLAIRLLQMLWAIIKGESNGFHHVDEAQEALRELELLKEHERRLAAQSGEGKP